MKMDTVCRRIGLVALFGMGVVACRDETPVGPDPTMKSQSATPKSGQGGALFRTNTPDTDPDQHFIADAVVNAGDPPLELLTGPAILTFCLASEGDPYYYSQGFYLANGTDCGTPPAAPGVALSLGPEFRVAVPTGKTLCFAPPEAVSDPPIRLFVRGYRPYQ